MKLRIRGNSLRFRLTKSEVQKLADEGKVIEETNFHDPNAAFRYCVCADSDVQEAAAFFTDGKICVRLNGRIVSEWASGDAISLDYNQKMENDQSLRILVEKDFRCLVPRGEEDDDAFPNPTATDGAGC